MIEESAEVVNILYAAMNETFAIAVPASKCLTVDRARYNADCEMQRACEPDAQLT